MGSTNYCLRALIEKGWVKAQNFANNPQKGRYIYQLTGSEGLRGYGRAVHVITSP